MEVPAAKLILVEDDPSLALGLVDTLEFLAGLVHPELFDAPPGDVARPLQRAATGAE